MKKLFVIAAMMVAAVTANAQQMFIKPMVGGTLTTFTGDADNAKMKVGLVAGAEFGYNFAENMGVTAGLLYTMQGSGVKDFDDKQKCDYLNIPVLFNYYVIPGLALKAGVQPGFLMSAKYGDTDMKDAYEKIDFAIPLGASYEISDFVIDARYNLGLTDIAKSNLAKVHNSVIMLTIGYKIPF